MTYTTIAQIDSRIAEIQEELDFYREFRSDFTIRELSAVRKTLHSEWRELNSLRFELDLDAITNDFIEDIETLCQEAMYPVVETAQEEPAIEVVAETVEDELLLEPATEVASDDWLLEEWDNICSDPAGERFNRPTPAPAFNTYFEYVLWVIGEVVRGITYLLGEVNDLFISSQTTQLAT